MKIILSAFVILSGMLFNFFVKKTAEPVLPTRETVEEVSYAKGIIRQVGNTDVYMIECGEKHLKLNPINLPSEYKEADLPVVFSGDIKVTPPLEDEFGDYFDIKSIH
jgi:hypothetical protein